MDSQTWVVTGFSVGVYLLHVAPYKTARELREVAELGTVALELVCDPEDECDDANGSCAEYGFYVDMVAERGRCLR